MIRLTPRETAVVRLVASGLSNKEIAAALEISHQTIRNHLSSVYCKWHVNDRTQAVIYAFAKGLIAPQEAFSQMRAYMRQEEL